MSRPFRPAESYSGALFATCLVCTGGASTIAVAKTSDDSAKAVAAARAGQIGSRRVGDSSSARARAISVGLRVESLNRMRSASRLARATAKPMERR